ncbi:S26 family signal peptidase [Sphingomonas jatrophae]|nr:S26 family signal peptidase [Sphingomonas jatrophae]
MPAPLRLLLTLIVLLGAGLLVGASFARTHKVTGSAMMPTLWPGDRLLVRPLRGGDLPARGAVVLVQDGPVLRATRLIGLPGDRIGATESGLRFDGRVLPRFRVADFVLPATAGLPCPVAPTGGTCRIARYREMTRDGRYRDVLPGGSARPDARVPAGQMLLLGDARGGAVPRLVPLETLKGRATKILWSSTGEIGWTRFWRWGETLRPGRILLPLDRGTGEAKQRDDERRRSL